MWTVFDSLAVIVAVNLIVTVLTLWRTLHVEDTVNAVAVKLGARITAVEQSTNERKS